MKRTAEDFTFIGEVHSALLGGDKKYDRHLLRAKISIDEMETIKTYISTYPKCDGIDDKEFRWPFEVDKEDGTQNLIRFTNKDNGAEKYMNTWDGRNKTNETISTEDEHLAIDSSEIRSGDRVWVDYERLIYDGKVSQGRHSKGCVLRLISIGLLGDAHPELLFDSPRKKRKISGKSTSLM